MRCYVNVLFSHAVMSSCVAFVYVLYVLPFSVILASHIHLWVFNPSCVVIMDCFMVPFEDIQARL